MTDFSYLKQAIKQAGVTLQQLADQCGVTKGYLSQLINNKIKSPGGQKLAGLHSALGLDYPLKQKITGGVREILPAAHRPYLPDPAGVQPGG